MKRLGYILLTFAIVYTVVSIISSSVHGQDPLKAYTSITQTVEWEKYIKPNDSLIWSGSDSTIATTAPSSFTANMGYIELGNHSLTISMPNGESVTLNLQNGTHRRSGNVTDEAAAEHFWELLAKYGAQHAKVEITIGK